MKPNSQGLINATHMDNGDQCLLTSMYHSCVAACGDHITSYEGILFYDRKTHLSYDHAMWSLEINQSGRYLRGVAIEGKTTAENWWFDIEGGRNTSRDQLSMVACAHVLWQDTKRARRHFRAWTKRGFFAQNVSPNYELPCSGNKKVPDLMTPSLLALFIRGGEYKSFYWLLYFLDLFLIVDLCLAKRDHWDEKMKLTVVAIACNHVRGNFITRWIIRKLMGIQQTIREEVSKWGNLNGASDLHSFVLAALSWEYLSTEK